MFIIHNTIQKARFAMILNRFKIFFCSFPLEKGKMASYN